MNPKYVRVSTGEATEEYEQRHGYWLLANLSQHIGIPKEKTLVQFCGRLILLLPGDETLLPASAILCADSEESREEARLIVMRLVSSLSWVDGIAINILHWSGGGRPFRASKGILDSSGVGGRRIRYLPDVQDENARLALAFYREALGLNHIAYSFLSYYKILNLRYRKTQDQKAWIGRTLSSLTDKDAIKRADELSASESDIAKYLYRSCRCAVAHAGSNPTVDPESIEDELRLRADLPLIKNLAEIMIESEFGIESGRTVWAKHQYELSGFKEILGDDMIDRISRGGKSDVEAQLPDSISIRLWRKENYLSFEGMAVEVQDAANGKLYLKCKNDEVKISFLLELNFIEERLVIDPVEGIVIRDDGSPEMAEKTAETYRFLADYFCNGELEIWDTNEDRCIGRCDPFIPVNVNLNETIRNFREAEKALRELAIRRSASEDNSTSSA